MVMMQSLQPKGRDLESMYVRFFYLYSIRLISFIIDVPRPLRMKFWIILFQKVDA